MVNTIHITNTAATIAAIESGMEFSYVAYGPVARHMATPYGEGWTTELARLREQFHNRPR